VRKPALFAVGTAVVGGLAFVRIRFALRLALFHLRLHFFAALRVLFAVLFEPCLPFFTAFFGIGFALRLPLLHLRFHFFAALRILFAVLVKARFSFRATFFGISGALRLPLFHPGFHLLAPLRIGLAAFGHGSFARIRVTCLRDYRRTGIGMNGGARQSLRTRK
jgi:hypothetical protein